jgi:hypothetical protein
MNRHRFRAWCLFLGLAVVCWLVGYLTSLDRAQETAEDGASTHGTHFDPTRSRAVGRQRESPPRALAPPDERGLDPREEEEFVRWKKMSRAPPAVWHPRDPNEWQGMLVNVAEPIKCPTGFCNLGRACIDGRCLPCTSDADCERGEACVLDHCVPQGNVECRFAADCAADDLCVLTDYDVTDRRGTASMSAYCLAPAGGGERNADRGGAAAGSVAATGNGHADATDLVEADGQGPPTRDEAQPRDRRAELADLARDEGLFRALQERTGEGD